MTVNGIIAEYNPFHNGHLHHINVSKEVTGADYTIVVMSGNFTQRGEPAIIDKFTRAEMALVAGADLVIELPIPYATASAEHFALGGVTLLDKLQVVTHLCFGSEAGAIAPLEEVATLLTDLPAALTAKINDLLKTGLSYPSAREEAIRALYGESYSDSLSQPNNILGIEYLKAIKKSDSSILPCTIGRHLTGYHEKEGVDHIASAGAIRDFFKENRALEDIQTYLPANCQKILAEYLKSYACIYPDDFSELLYYKLLTDKKTGYQQYFDLSKELSNRILGNLYSYQSYTQFCELLDTRNFTYTRISRSLNHILLGTQSLPEISYARILGFRKSAGPLLSCLKKQALIPLITKLADAKQQLDETSYQLLEKDLNRNDIYEGVLAHKSNVLPRNEYTRQIIIIE